jgi:hypothetical protein
MEFPVYRLQDFDSYDDAFADLAEYLVNASQSCARQQPPGTWSCVLTPREHGGLDASCREGAQCPGWTVKFLSKLGDHANFHEAATLFTELTQLLAAWAWIEGNHFMSSMYSDDEGAKALKANTTSRTVTLIDFDCLFPLDWTMPASVLSAMDLGVTYKIAKFTPDPSANHPAAT